MPFLINRPLGSVNGDGRSCPIPGVAPGQPGLLSRVGSRHLEAIIQPAESDTKPQFKVPGRIACLTAGLEPATFPPYCHVSESFVKGLNA
jgi:hypothetical protein